MCYIICLVLCMIWFFDTIKEWLFQLITLFMLKNLNR